MEPPLNYVSVKKGKMSISEHKIKEIVQGSFKDLEQFVDNFDGKVPVFDYPKFSYGEEQKVSLNLRPVVSHVYNAQNYST